MQSELRCQASGVRGLHFMPGVRCRPGPECVETLAQNCRTHGHELFGARATPTHVPGRRSAPGPVCQRSRPSRGQWARLARLAPGSSCDVDWHGSSPLRTAGLHCVAAVGPASLCQCIGDACGRPWLQGRFLTVAPACMGRCAFTFERTLGCSRALFGVIPDHELPAVPKVQSGLIPDPRRTVADHLRILSLLPAPPRASARTTAPNTSGPPR